MQFFYTAPLGLGFILSYKPKADALGYHLSLLRSLTSPLAKGGIEQRRDVCGDARFA